MIKPTFLMRKIWVVCIAVLFPALVGAQTVVNENGDFSDATIGDQSGITNWNLQGTSYADYEIVADPEDANDKVLKVTITNIGGVSNAWDIQPLHQNTSLQNGTQYKVLFRIKADPQGGGTPTINVAPGYNARYGVDISGSNNQWQTVEVDKFTATGTGAQQMGIHLGSSNNADSDVFYIDDFVVIESPQSAVKQTWDFESGTDGWGDADHGATVTASTDQANGGSQSIKIVGASDDASADIRNYSVSNVVEGNSVEFSIYMSSADQSNLSYLQLEFHGDGFGSYANADIGAHQVTGDQWSRVSVTVPAIGSTPLAALDIKAVMGSDSDQPTIYIDDISVNSAIYTGVINDSEGWRMISTPVSASSYSDLLENIWTQGASSGADYSSGSSNVRTFDGSIFNPVNDLTTDMTPGTGFITYVYNDDNYDSSPDGFPKALQVAGTENSGAVNPTINSGADTWSLVGNPYASTIDWDNLTKTELTGTAYVYDHRIPGYISWNGTTGDLTGGLIRPFQGFWVQNTSGASSPSLTIEEADKSSGGKLYKQSANTVPIIKLNAEMEDLRNSAFFSFTSDGKIGKDNRDALKLEPLDHADYLRLATEADGELLDINNMPLNLNEEVEVPLSVTAFKAIDGGYSKNGGEIKLTWPKLANIPEGWSLSLVDYTTGGRVDLKATKSYTFTIEGSKQKVKSRSADSDLSPIGIRAERSDDNRFGLIINPNAETLDAEDTEVVKQFALDQNYPNPFNPTTTIRYDIASQTTVELSVYNVMGQKVATLVHEAKAPGSYRAVWNAEDMSSGIYYYRLNAGSKTFTRQMTLIK